MVTRRKRPGITVSQYTLTESVCNISLLTLLQEDERILRYIKILNIYHFVTYMHRGTVIAEQCSLNQHACLMQHRQPFWFTPLHARTSMP